ncbi:SPOR domain-containing protein [Marinomonas transparens]|uniref:SPOR domain-containing protein n=1 Tax=Marinomonas transparens TaxID=2795388 RepID=A0A934N3S6_9GAMM|nr:SPOR domain-containing protein [Marinomonas transparens]MBJ7539992.1 SPOR domain-containing protein [Marinomonas transparens]
MKILILVATLLIAGIALTVSLPTFQAPSINKTQAANYLINQDSLSSPLDMKDFLLITPTPSDSTFTLRLGLYSQLQQAVTEAKAINAPSKTVIIKVTDKNREWYLVLLGQYATLSQAEQQRRWLQNNQTSATLMLLPAGLTL